MLKITKNETDVTLTCAPHTHIHIASYNGRIVCARMCVYITVQERLLQLTFSLTFNGKSGSN